MLSIPQEISALVGSIFSARGVPDYVWKSIAAMETGGSFDPTTKNVNMPGQPGYDSSKPAESSWGLFQLNTNGGQGAAYAGDPTPLLDPVKNSLIAVGPIASAYIDGKQRGMQDGPELAAYVAANSGHPGYGLDLSYHAVQVVAGYAKQELGIPDQPSGSTGDGGISAGADAVTDNRTPFQKWFDSINPFKQLDDARKGAGELLKGAGNATKGVGRWLILALILIVGVMLLGISASGLIRKPAVVVEGGEVKSEA